MNEPSFSFIAHIRIDDDGRHEHALSEHLREVSKKAGDFAQVFGVDDWARWAGLWHDLGKFRAGFQRYIRQCADADAHIEGKVAGAEKTHSAAGALWAQQEKGGVVARVLSYLIAGHHAGLDDWEDGLSARFYRDTAQRELQDTLAADIPASILKPDWPLPEAHHVKAERLDRADEIPGRFALWVRMLFSCLVDADFLDTEAFMSPDKAATRQGFMPLPEMEKRLDVHLADKCAEVAARGESYTPVNQKRADVLRACRNKAELPPGVFSLTVPTGGGKTLSSLAFALRHANRHNKRRIVYAIPYTSIIEQTANEFRKIFGNDNVIEHHSNVEVKAEAETARSRLACENWDAPLIVTTNVQLFESLFAARTSRCRKLHNLAGSVIVLDEAQLLPVNYLQPVMDALRLLVKDYGVTLVLCTATQPNLEMRQSFDLARALRGFAKDEVREIIDDIPALYAALNRVRYHLPADLHTPCTWEGLADDLMRHEAVLIVVGRRADARDLYQCLKAKDKTGLWHLSGLMCAQHRSDVIEKIKKALKNRRKGLSQAPIRVVSTQLVEAGVDMDFPVVYRALAGLDSIVQAAGRRNREGRLTQGEVHVFVPPKAPPPGLLRLACATTRSLWANLPEDADRMGVECFADYFRKLYGDANLDEKQICELLRVNRDAAIPFRTAAEKFRLIDDEGSTLFVRYRRNEKDGEIDMLLNTLKKQGPERWLMRKLQRYGVTLYQQDVDRLLQDGDIEALAGDCPGVYVQASDLLYDEVLGVVAVDGAPGDPAKLTY